MGELHVLSESQCRALLADAETGRVAVVAPDGPHVIPVSYALVDESVIFRTNPFTLLGRYATCGPIAFEVDYTDATTRTGWSVVARGHAREIHDASELQHISRVWEPMPWAGGERNLHLRLSFAELTGRSVAEVPRRAWHEY